MISTAVVDGAEIVRRGVEHAGLPRYVRLSVRDTGHGIDAGTMARIFEPFFSTRERGKGSGLGLSTVYGIVKQCGGFIFADSHPGQGSVFHVYFPQVEAAAARRPSGETRIASPSLEPTRRDLVLLVDDEELIRNLAEQILADRGYEVVTAGSLEQAESAAAGGFDLLVCDIDLPDGTGIELIARLSATRPIRAIAMSGYGTAEDIERSTDAGFHRHLVKPFTADRLFEAVALALA